MGELSDHHLWDKDDGCAVLAILEDSAHIGWKTSSRYPTSPIVSGS